MKKKHSMVRVLAVVAALLFFPLVALTQTSQSEHEAHHPAAQAQGAGNTETQGMGMMSGGQGMMGGKQMMGMPMMACCPCEMMGMGMMMGGGKDSGMAARMMEMRAEMMKSNAEILEKYAKQMQMGK